MAPNKEFGAFYVHRDKNLHDVMNDVAAALERRGCTPRRMPRGEALTELQAFAALDPLLLDLRKEYLNAQEYRRQIEKDFGCDDGMTDMAILAEDSAWCAMQTRYMELRADSCLLMEAQALMEQCALEKEKRDLEVRQQQALENYQYMSMLSRIQRQKEQDDSYFWLLFWVLAGGRAFFPLSLYPARNFNQIAA